MVMEMVPRIIIGVVLLGPNMALSVWVQTHTETPLQEGVQIWTPGVQIDPSGVQNRLF